MLSFAPGYSLPLESLRVRARGAYLLAARRLKRFPGRTRNPHGKEWQRGKVRQFHGCCTADSQTDVGKNEIDNNQKLPNLSFFPPLRMESWEALLLPAQRQNSPYSLTVRDLPLMLFLSPCNLPLSANGDGRYKCSERLRKLSCGSETILIFE